MFTKFIYFNVLYWYKVYRRKKKTEQKKKERKTIKHFLNNIICQLKS